MDDIEFPNLVYSTREGCLVQDNIDPEEEYAIESEFGD